MTERFIPWWRTRTLREQRLLLAMFGLLGAVLAWLLILRPLGDALSEAREWHGDAVIAVAEARAQAAAIAQLQNAAPVRLSAPVATIVGQAATAAGFTPTRVEAEGGDRVTIVISAVRPQAFFGWVGQMESGQGLIVERLSATANSDQTLAVEATFRARGG